MGSGDQGEVFRIRKRICSFMDRIFRLDIHSGEGKPNVSDESSAASVQSGNDGISREACF